MPRRDRHDCNARYAKSRMPQFANLDLWRIPATETTETGAGGAAGTALHVKRPISYPAREPFEREGGICGGNSTTTHVSVRSSECLRQREDPWKSSGMTSCKRSLPPSL